MNPGLSYVAVTWQVAVEAIVPLNSEAGRSVGARAQLAFVPARPHPIGFWETAPEPLSVH